MSNQNEMRHLVSLMRQMKSNNDSILEQIKHDELNESGQTVSFKNHAEVTT